MGMDKKTPLGEDEHGTLGWAHRHLVDWAIGKNDIVDARTSGRKMTSRNMLPESGADEAESDLANFERS